MIEELSQLGVLAGVVVAVGGGFGALAWATKRTARRKAKPVIPIFDEAASVPELAPWSPTRGFYWFPATALPEEYLDLSGVNDGATFKQFGEDEADALFQLNARLGRRYLQERLGVPPKIAAVSIKFQPLNKRKARTP